ncbi:MAG: CRISPR-associated helicase Cas3' [Crenarchaeota archaeon]|nr:CRISPR-associated helicase Cas3' [Thermoproteota archaeon]
MKTEYKNNSDKYWQIVEEVVKSRGRKLQRYSFFEDVWRAIDEGCRLIVVKAPTGGGKTEATTTPFLRDLKFGNRRWLSLIHVLPTRALVNSMRWRYAEAFAALKIRNAVVAYEYGQLSRVKPYLDGDVVVTTYDTLLYRFYGVDLKAPHILGQVSKLINSLLIMDEAQLLQDDHWYAMSLLPYHIAALIEFGTQVILMTATLPTVLLRRIEDSVRESLRDADPSEISIMTSSSKPARGKVSLELKNDKLPCSKNQLVNIIHDFYPGIGSVLIVANTVEKAAAIYKSLMELYLERSIHLKPILLHSRLRQGIRKEIEELLELRKNEEFILVATQVVEAGLDLDSTLLITEVSPIDSIIQRIGRCGRRRDGFAIIFTESDGALKVYPKVLIEKTKQVVIESQDLLVESLKRVDAAQFLLDQVFDQESINLLMRNVEQAYVVAEWIKRYWIYEVNIHSWIAHFPPDQLLRLGIELPSYKPRSPEEYASFLMGNELRMGLESLEENIVKLTIKNSSEENIVMPAAIIHKIDDKCYCVQLELMADEESDEVRLKPLRIPIERMRKVDPMEIIEGRKIFLLNPSYYESIELDGLKLDIGVVNPWLKI